MDPLAQVERLLLLFLQNLVRKVFGGRHDENVVRDAENDGNGTTVEQATSASSADAKSTSSKLLEQRDNTTSTTEIVNSVTTQSFAAVSSTESSSRLHCKLAVVDDAGNQANKDQDLSFASVQDSDTAVLKKTSTNKNNVTQAISALIASMPSEAEFPQFVPISSSQLDIAEGSFPGASVMKMKYTKGHNSPHSISTLETSRLNDPESSWLNPDFSTVGDSTTLVQHNEEAISEGASTMSSDSIQGVPALHSSMKSKHQSPLPEPKDNSMTILNTEYVQVRDAAISEGPSTMKSDSTQVISVHHDVLQSESKSPLPKRIDSSQEDANNTSVEDTEADMSIGISVKTGNATEDVCALHESMPTDSSEDNTAFVQDIYAVASKRTLTEINDSEQDVYMLNVLNQNKLESLHIMPADSLGQNVNIGSYQDSAADVLTTTLKSRKSATQGASRLQATVQSEQESPQSLPVHSSQGEVSIGSVQNCQADMSDRTSMMGNNVIQGILGLNVSIKSEPKSSQVMPIEPSEGDISIGPVLTSDSVVVGVASRKNYVSTQTIPTLHAAKQHDPELPQPKSSVSSEGVRTGFAVDNEAFVPKRTSELGNSATHDIPELHVSVKHEPKSSHSMPTDSLEGDVNTAGDQGSNAYASEETLIKLKDATQGTNTPLVWTQNEVKSHHPELDDRLAEDANTENDQDFKAAVSKPMVFHDDDTVFNDEHIRSHVDISMPLQLSASDSSTTTSDIIAEVMKSHGSATSSHISENSGECTGVAAIFSSLVIDQMRSDREKSPSLPSLESDPGSYDDDSVLEIESDFTGLDTKRLASSQITEALPNLSQKHDILRQLCGKLMGNHVLVLVGGAGSGKTTAALLVAHYAPVWFGDGFNSYLYYGDNEYLPETVITFPSDSLIVIDDFLGRHEVDILSYWNAVVPLLESMKDNADRRILLLLTSRTAIFQNLLSSEGTDVRMHFNENHVTTITIDYRKMWKEICKGVKLKIPDFEMSPSIGFPLCCQLAPHLATDDQTILFQQPRLALRRTVRTLMDSTSIARTALTLLAVEKGSLDMNIFTSLPRLQESRCYEILDFLPQGSNDEETSAQIIEFYRNCTFLFQVCNDAVSFRSEVIREAVLVVLCDSHAELLAKYCSLELLSKIALATSDKDTSDDAEKPVLSDSVKSVFLRGLLGEMTIVNNFDAMFSPFFQHHSFLSMFESTVKEENLLKQWTQKCSLSGLHFVFYAGAVPSVFKNALSELDKRNLWVVLQAVLACCYWGYNSDIPALMKVWKNKTDLKKALKEATILDIVTGNLPGLSRKDEPWWELTPLFPEDTLLVLAARRGNDAVVKTLAFRDMNVNSQGMDGHTALMHYCAQGRRDMVQFLLGRKADLNIRDKSGMTALIYALQRKQWDIPEDLMTSESCRAENTYLQSPLMIACTNEWSIQMIRTLIEKGGNIMQRDKWGYTCLHYACLHGHTDIVAYLLKQKKVDVRGKSLFGHTPLTLAVTSPGRSKLVALLLHTEAAKDADDTEVVRMVCRASDTSVLETFLSACRQKADIKNFALREASRYGNTGMVRYLLRSDADPGARNPSDLSTALHSACVGSSVDCCEILLYRTDPNVLTTRGSTPLMTALEVGALDCARLLSRRGAKLNANSTLGSCLHHATNSNLCSTLDWCIKENKMDVNMRNSAGRTPLQQACLFGTFHSVKYLLNNGADTLSVDNNGDTCLHHAARGGHWDIVELLREKADSSLINARNASGETPAQLLKESMLTWQSASAESASKKVSKNNKRQRH